MPRPTLRASFLLGLLGLLVVVGVSRSRGRTTAEVVGELRGRGVGADLGDPAAVESVALVAVKSARTLELWARKPGAAWMKLRTYPFTAYSGGLGPKLREGDG